MDASDTESLRKFLTCSYVEHPVETNVANVIALGSLSVEDRLAGKGGGGALLFLESVPHEA